MTDLETPCPHEKTKVVDWCFGRNKPCPSPDCGINFNSHDNGFNCNELAEKEICEKCGKQV